ncbi:MAG: hypothetical protein FJZ78_02185 [Bacteroidetes bacterium]|nr:hypothetical protein [Bacteroidota bacterium]
MNKFLIVLLLACTTCGFAQPFELDFTGYGEKYFKLSEKKVHISTFKVNYQIMYTDSEFQAGGSTLGGGMKGSAKAILMLGLKGPTSEELVKTTDEIYEEFVKRLKNSGYTLVGLDNLTDFEPYEGWNKVKGGIGSEAQMKGFISVSPSGFEYMVKKIKDSGKESNGFDAGVGTRNNKLSKELGGALVLNVVVNVPMAKPGKDFKTGLVNALGGAAVSAVTDLRLGGSVGLNFMKKLGEQGGTNAFIKGETFPIEGVMESKSYKAMAVAKTDWGTSAGMYTYFSFSDEEMKNMQPIEVDAPKYYSSVKGATVDFLNTYMDKIDGYINKK